MYFHFLAYRNCGTELHAGDAFVFPVQVDIDMREEKEKAIREVRSEIADLSIAIAEKVMKEKISRDKEQQQIIDRLLDEVSFCKS